MPESAVGSSLGLSIVRVSCLVRKVWGRMRKRIVFVFVGAAVAVTACSGGGSHRSSSGTTLTAVPTTTATSVSQAAASWSRSDLSPVSQPVVAAGTVTVYTAGGGGLQLVGLDPATGSTRWTMTTSTGNVTPGVAPELTTDGTRLFYLAQTAGGTALAALDANSGRQVWASQAGSFTSWPELCPGDPADVCSTGSITGNGATLLRFAASSGRPLTSPQISPSASARELAPGLFDAGARSPETLVAASGPTVGWAGPLARMYSMAGESTDNGWNLDRINQIGLFVGSVGGPAASQTANKAVLDLSKTMTAGFRISNGSVVWTDNGTTYLCSILPCPGATLTASSGAGAGDSAGPHVGLRIRGAGTITETRGNPTPTPSPGLRATLEGFDPASGRTTWTFDITSDIGLVTQSQLPPRVGQTEIILPGKAGVPVEVDLATGAERPVPAGTVAWCETPTTFKENPGYQASNGQVINDYTGNYAVLPCGPDQHQASDPAQAPAFVGPAVDGLVIWSEPNKVVAAPLQYRDQGQV